MNSEVKINEQEYIPKETQTLKMNPTEILAVKNSIKEMKNEQVSLGSKADQMEFHLFIFAFVSLAQGDTAKKKNTATREIWDFTAYVLF